MRQNPGQAIIQSKSWTWLSLLEQNISECICITVLSCVSLSGYRSKQMDAGQMSELDSLYLAGKYDASFARCPSIKVCADTRLGIPERTVADAFGYILS